LISDSVDAAPPNLRPRIPPFEEPKENAIYIQDATARNSVP
jgi:hypothetical protein